MSGRLTFYTAPFGQPRNDSSAQRGVKKRARGASGSREPHEAALSRPGPTAPARRSRGRSSSVTGSPSMRTPPWAISRLASLVEATPRRSTQERRQVDRILVRGAGALGHVVGRPVLSHDPREMLLRAGGGLLAVRSGATTTRASSSFASIGSPSGAPSARARAGTTGRAARPGCDISLAELLLGRSVDPDVVALRLAHLLAVPADEERHRERRPAARGRSASITSRPVSRL